MINSTIKLFSDDEKRVVADLKAIGMSRKAAHVMTYLIVIGPCVSEEIEQATGLRQPEVSLGVSELKKWILVEREEGTRRKVISFNVPAIEILEYYYAKLMSIRENQDTSYQSLEKLVAD
jgi:predicted transcriptional regulator